MPHKRNFCCLKGLYYVLSVIGWGGFLEASIQPHPEEQLFQLPSAAKLRASHESFVARFLKIKSTIKWFQELETWGTHKFDKLLLEQDTMVEGKLILSFGALKSTVLHVANPSILAVQRLLAIYRNGLPGMAPTLPDVQSERSILTRALGPLLHVAYFSHAISARSWQFPQKWVTASLNDHKAYGYSLYEVKQQALLLDMGAVGLLLDSYAEGGFGIPIQNPQVWQEFQDLVYLFYPFLQVVPYFALEVQADHKYAVRELSCPQMDQLLMRSPLCYVLSFSQNQRDAVYNLCLRKCPLVQPLCPLAQHLMAQHNKESMSLLEGLHEDVWKILNDRHRLKTASADEAKDDRVLEGKLTLKQLKHAVLMNAGGAHDFKYAELLALSHAQGYFGIPLRNRRVRVEGTLWLFLKAVEELMEGGTTTGHRILFGRALVENWFGEVASNNGFVEGLALLEYWFVAKEGPLQKKAATLLRCPLFLYPLKQYHWEGTQDGLSLSHKLTLFLQATEEKTG